LIAGAKIAQSNTHVTLASDSAQFIVKALLSGSNKSLASEGAKATREAYTGALKDYMTRKNSRLTSRFFTDLIDRQPVAVSGLCEVLIAFGQEARSDFLKAEALRMSAALLKKHALIKESFSGARSQKLGSHVGQAIEGLLDSSWSKAKQFRQALDFAQVALKFLSLLGVSVGDAARLAEKASGLAQGDKHPSPAVLVGLKTVSNLLLGKTTTPQESKKAKKRRLQESQAEDAEGATGGEQKQKKGKSSKGAKSDSDGNAEKPQEAKGKKAKKRKSKD